MKYSRHLMLCFLCFVSLLSGTEFTVASYNCGGLADHYDYLRAASMQALMSERHVAEPENMDVNERIQKLALKILFTPNAADKALAQQEWDEHDFSSLLEFLTATPPELGGPNSVWNKKAEAIISSYKVRPIVIRDEAVREMLMEHLRSLDDREESNMAVLLQKVRKVMAIEIFSRHLNHDIICLQEANYLEASMFPQNYEVLIAAGPFSKNGIAWDKTRFELVNLVGDIVGRAFAVLLRDRESDKTVLIASGHFTGCNPYRTQIDSSTGVLDSAKGDAEMQTVIGLFDGLVADLKIIGMDSNVTSLHPRLTFLKEAGYGLDYENYLDPTCTNPYQVLDTRIDWIALKSDDASVSITNIPVSDVGLNSIQTNMSDHKPIAAKIIY